MYKYFTSGGNGCDERGDYSPRGDTFPRGVISLFEPQRSARGQSEAIGQIDPNHILVAIITIIVGVVGGT